MATPRRILVPFDFIGPSMRACDHAMELGASLGASICLLHVVERFDVRLTAAERHRLLAAAKAELESAARRMRSRVREVETVVVEGTPWEAIETVAGERGVDL